MNITDRQQTDELVIAKMWT